MWGSDMTTLVPEPHRKNMKKEICDQCGQEINPKIWREYQRNFLIKKGFKNLADLLYPIINEKKKKKRKLDK